MIKFILTPIPRDITIFFVKAQKNLSDIKSSDVKISNLPKIPKGKKLESIEIVVNITD